MKALLKKPVEGLEVGQMYELVFNKYERWVLRGGLWTEDDGPGWRGVDVFDYFFVFQELPEQLKTQIRQVIGEDAGATVYIPDVDEQAEMLEDALNAVCKVLEGETIDD